MATTNLLECTARNGATFLRVLALDRAEPPLGHDRCAVARRMNAVSCPSRRRRELHRGIKHRLKRHEHRAPFFCHALRCSAIAVEFGKPRIIDVADLERERLANREFHMWKRIL